MLSCFEDIKKHTLACYPNEMCGLILSDDSFIPLENIHEKPENNFRISAVAISQYLGNIKYICHSHTRPISKPEVFDLRTPSYRDIIEQKITGVPWLIFGTEGETVTTPLEIPRIANNKYLGRPFIWFINDCYSLIQDWYRFELNIVLPDHKGECDYLELRKFSNLFDEHIKEYGFTEYYPIGHSYRNGDIVLLDNAGFTRNHLGIYIDGKILHQDMISRLEPLEYFINRIHVVLRYENKDI